MKKKIWIVVMIDHYGGDMQECWCTFNNYSGLKVFHNEKDAQDFANHYEKNHYAASAEIEEVEL